MSAAQRERQMNLNRVGDERDIASTEAPPEQGHRWFAAIFDRMGRSEENGFLGQMRHDLLSSGQWRRAGDRRRDRRELRALSTSRPGRRA